jgi:hypothetical protein
MSERSSQTSVQPAAGDDVKHLVETHRKLSDEEYEKYMRAQFA